MEKAERAPTGKSLIRIGPPSHWMTGPKALERARVLEKIQKGKERAKKKGAKNDGKHNIQDETDLGKVLQACKKTETW